MAFPLPICPSFLNVHPYDLEEDWVWNPIGPPADGTSKMGGTLRPQAMMAGAVWLLHQLHPVDLAGVLMIST